MCWGATVAAIFGVEAAGHVIMSFGQFVVGGNFIVGTVVFLVLIAIQFVVINHGAVRISEVTARFTLDAMPGRQMAIDADLNAGLIDEREARRADAPMFLVGLTELHLDQIVVCTFVTTVDHLAK